MDPMSGFAVWAVAVVFLSAVWWAERRFGRG